jgi:transposase
VGNEDHYPDVCIDCGHPLEGEDPHPYRCQIIELPPLQPVVFEHRFHALECPGIARAIARRISSGVIFGEVKLNSFSCTGTWRLSKQLLIYSDMGLTEQYWGVHNPTGADCWDILVVLQRLLAVAQSER